MKKINEERLSIQECWRILIDEEVDDEEFMEVRECYEVGYFPDLTKDELDFLLKKFPEMITNGLGEYILLETIEIMTQRINEKVIRSFLWGIKHIETKEVVLLIEAVTDFVKNNPNSFLRNEITETLLNLYDNPRRF